MNVHIATCKRGIKEIAETHIQASELTDMSLAGIRQDYPDFEADIDYSLSNRDDNVEDVPVQTFCSDIKRRIEFVQGRLESTFFTSQKAAKFVRKQITGLLTDISDEIVKSPDHATDLGNYLRFKIKDSRKSNEQLNIIKPEQSSLELRFAMVLKKDVL